MLEHSRSQEHSRTTRRLKPLASKPPLPPNTAESQEDTTLITPGTKSKATQEALETEAGCVGVTCQGTIRGCEGVGMAQHDTAHGKQTQSQHAAAGW